MQTHASVRGGVATATTVHSEERQRLLITLPSRQAFLHQYWQKHGEAGLFIPGGSNLKPGQLVNAEIMFVDPHMVFNCTAEVRWKRPVGNSALPAGIGIAFCADDQQTHEILVQFARGELDRSLTQRRRRLPVALGVRIVADGQQRVLQTENLSPGGAFISSVRPPEVGTLVSISFGSTPATRVDLDAAVVWSRPRPPSSGFGVRFLIRSQYMQESVVELVERARRTVVSSRS